MKITLVLALLMGVNSYKLRPYNKEYIEWADGVDESEIEQMGNSFSKDNAALLSRVLDQPTG